MTHAVPADQQPQTDRTLAATRGIKGEPSDAERSRTLLANARIGSLATICIEPAGYPFGSLVNYAADDAGRPLLCLSDLAEHSRNMAADPRASLLLTEASQAEMSQPATDPLAGGRVTLIGDVSVLSGSDRAVARDLYRSAHPGAFWADFDDFRFYRLSVESVRYVGGFGRMSWVGAAEYASAEPDPLVPFIDRIVTHMNDDHGEALLDFCRMLAGRPSTAVAEMAHVDRYGFDVMSADTADGDRTAVRIVFPERCDTPDAVRAAMVALVHQIRA